MKVEIKTLARSEWSRLIERADICMPIENERLRGYAGLICMKRTASPLRVRVGGRSVLIADDGFEWLQIAPEGKNWWLTTMFDPAGKVVQYYFDMTKENVIRGCESYFLDCFLDVACIPGEDPVLLDEDELKEAHDKGIVTREDCERAARTARMLMQLLPENFEALECFCSGMRAKLKEKLEEGANS